MFDGDYSDRLKSLVLTAPGKVPIEYLGLARQLRREVLQHDEIASAKLHAITWPVACRLRIHARMRPDTLIDIARRWRLELPTRLSLDFTGQWPMLTLRAPSPSVSPTRIVRPCAF